jgi:hypothetical protein
MTPYNTNNGHPLLAPKAPEGGALLILALLLALVAVAILVAAGAASGATPKSLIPNRKPAHRCCICPCDLKDYHRQCIHRCDLATDPAGKLLPMTRGERAACAKDCQELRSQKPGVRSKSQRTKIALAHSEKEIMRVTRCTY